MEIREKFQSSTEGSNGKEILFLVGQGSLFTFIKPMKYIDKHVEAYLQCFTTCLQHSATPNAAILD